MMNILAPLFRASYWFSLSPQPFAPWADRLVLVVMLLLVGSGLCAYAVASSRRLKEKDDRRVMRRIGACTIWAGIVGLILYVFTWMFIPLFSMRFWYVVWFIAFARWGYTIARFALKELPARHAGDAARLAYEKWLPKPKK